MMPARRAAPSAARTWSFTMNDLLRRTSGAALLACLALAAPSAAQDGQPARKDPPQDASRPEPERAPAERPAANPDAAQAQRAAADAGISREQVIKKMVEEESLHRVRLAKIQRLAELAQQNSQAERLEQLKELLKQENTRFLTKAQKARKVLGEDNFHVLEQRLAQGRMRQAQKPERKPDAQPPERKPDDKAKPPRTDGAARDGNAQAGGQRDSKPR